MLQLVSENTGREFVLAQSVAEKISRRALTQLGANESVEALVGSGSMGVVGVIRVVVLSALQSAIS